MDTKLAGRRHVFRSALVSVDMFHHPALLAAKRYLVLDPRRALSLLKEARKQVPIPYAVVEDIRNKLWVKGCEVANPLFGSLI